MRGLKALMVLSAIVSVPVFAEDNAVGVRAGMLGIGVEYSYRLSDRLTVRGGLNGSGIDFDDYEAGIHYDFNLNFDSLSVAVDVHPMKGPFRISGGFLRNDNELSATSTPTTSIEVGDVVYQPGEVGTLRGGVGFDGTAPFFSLGWDFRYEKKLGVTLELGLVDQGSPIVTLTASGTLAGDSAFQQELARERDGFQDALDDLHVYPFAMLGMAFRF